MCIDIKDLFLQSILQEYEYMRIYVRYFNPDIWQKYNIDSLTFALNNNYYAFYINDYEEIYNKVKDSLTLLKTTYDELLLQEEAEAKKKLKIKDSLKLIEASK